ncbi:tRNA guanosine(34) transglycosylase Tgt [Bacteroidales bacterium OttesenSCG-928-B11]|nr:tRNA guanosine(34) transglycosylase Tgt [Bacteroidales bacterium OttesenSCG-928-E04]MDL2309079.1 tRNA guanosine(34) transglycosylase Tgt [Bacteroidales bacterium OttesenSCG-928-C03]MDL2312187.1 tRNA guanosine(34) transglycosylase Tgt [Bacteroidales bacterium OttesenSCG-928-B11]MDL2326244.1 tRNA guanosine(34) transglycosylase Tgt [Bacteroidales bacterium OttesenSCG-928-A14]
MDFTISATDTKSSARAGEIKTDHGVIETPIFMPVGTLGGVKAVHTRSIEEDVKAQIILGNTYHLYLRPGIEVLEAAGGLHKFNGWHKPILTDSGGFQVFSLSHRRKIKPDEGVWFQSHIDGSRHLFSPEKVMDIQRSIGADIIMAFDECAPYPCEYAYAKNSMKITHNWLERCCKRFDETDGKYGYSQTLFPIVQGSVYKDLRKESAEFVASMNREGNAIGGVSVGEPTELMYEMTDICCRILPKDKPRYLMGVGTPANIIECIAMGVDMFDCVMPTRNGRNGMIFTWQGMLNMRNEKWKFDFTPIDENSDLFADRQYSKAFLRHLYTSGEMLGPMIGSLHNLHFYLDLVKTARQKITEGTFAAWKDEILPVISRKL